MRLRRWSGTGQGVVGRIWVVWTVVHSERKGRMYANGKCRAMLSILVYEFAGKMRRGWLKVGSMFVCTNGFGGGGNGNGNGNGVKHLVSFLRGNGRVSATVVAVFA